MKQINSDDLYQVLNEVEDWPTTGSELSAKAQDVGAPEPVMDFFESIPQDTVFDTEGEIIAIAEQVEIPDANLGETGDAESLPYEDA